MRFEHYESLGSTSERANQLANDGDIGPVWIQADQQTTGRGRLGRSWVSPEGNLYCTGLYPAYENPAKTALLGFAAALASSDLALEYLPEADIGLKWPNDIQLGGDKLSGILLETGKNRAGQDWVSIGVGMNLLSAPDLPNYKAISIAAHLDITDPEHVPNARSACATLAHRFDLWKSTLEQSGFEPLRKTWLSRANGLGKVISANHHGQSVQGIFKDIRQDGALLLEDNTGNLIEIRSGEIFLNS